MIYSKLLRQRLSRRAARSPVMAALLGGVSDDLGPLTRIGKHSCTMWGAEPGDWRRSSPAWSCCSHWVSRQIILSAAR